MRNDLLRQAITDENGVVDVAYLALFWVMVSVLGSIAFLCVMSTFSFVRCHQVAATATTPAVLCLFDPQPLGLAIGAICGGFATALGGLAAYMAATRRSVTQVTDRRQGSAGGTSVATADSVSAPTK